ncbi:MAG: hypothetical protein ACRD3W_25915, partial [Terriglobales bacterium]
ILNMEFRIRTGMVLINIDHRPAGVVVRASRTVKKVTRCDFGRVPPQDLIIGGLRWPGSPRRWRGGQQNKTGQTQRAEPAPHPESFTGNLKLPFAGRSCT